MICFSLEILVSRAHGTAPDKDSQELSPPVATVSESSPRLGKHGEGNDTKLTRGIRAGAVTEGGRQRRSKSAAASSRGHEARNRENR
jgi:hypothetical protein